MPKDPEQVDVESIGVSDDGRAVGWLPLYPNCCTSYPIPHDLWLHVGGKTRRIRGNGLPVWQWTFLEGGKLVALHQETAHGGIGIHYELREVATNRVVDTYDEPTWEELEHGAKMPPIPPWVDMLNSKR